MPKDSFLILGGGGMIGFQITQRIARRLKPKKIIIASLYQQEVREAIHILEKGFPGIEFVGFWGDVFIRSQLNVDDRQQRLSRRQILEIPEYRADLFADLFGDANQAYKKSQLVQLILDHKPDVIIDSINTATAISYQDIYTATEISHRELESFLKSTDANQLITPQQKEALIESFETLMISQYIPQLIRHVVLLNRAIREAGTRLYLKVGTTGTGGMGLNIPYTHGEDKPSSKLMSKTAIAFAHTGLMFLMARTPPDESNSLPPVIKEIKPAAMVGWIDITQRTIHRRGKTAYIHNSIEEKLDNYINLKLSEDDLDEIGKLKMVVVDTGENGVFAKGEFEAITALRQMEFMTPEEIARVVELEVRGVNTGKDVIAAIDGSIMGPTYRAGYLRRQALEDLTRLEEETQTPSVALGELGPPELSKLLWEAFLLKQVYGRLEAVLESTQEELSEGVMSYIENNPSVQNLITSVGIPILLADGKTIRRGVFIRIPEVAGRNELSINHGDLDRWADKGWVDLRQKNMAHWQERFSIMLRAKLKLIGRGSAAVDREAYLYEDIRIGEVVGWIFNNEMRGYRLK
jgi:hypothetical protein